MKAHYYCRECDYFFWEENKIPDMNRLHNKCGSRAKLLKYIQEPESNEG
ncbi:MAG: hypothetical protein AAB536_02440 [Patescibacteria group bacterium]